MVYDPRITQQDLNSYEESVQGSPHQPLHFAPSQKTAAKAYDMSKHTKIRIEYFIGCLADQSNEQAQMIPLLLPLLRDVLLKEHK